MRWIYRDPQGNIQGPWTGLEMHDWFKAGFFSAELLVKKCEDPEFEPLGQLIRRIGNSREPFLVPQIGIPYGPPSGQGSGTWNGNNSSSGNQGSSPAGAVQPPFAGAFPSFGTTLTAEQQNALERRKQEEQFLMARQKEFLAQQQVLQKQMQQIHGVHSQQLHHHSSTHSLHSQPSFGSMTSHSGFHPHPTPPQGPTQLSQGVTGFFDVQIRHGSATFMAPLSLGSEFGNSGPSNTRDDELAALLARQNLNRDGQPLPHNFGTSFLSQQLDNAGHAQQVAAILAQRAQLQREQAKHDTMLGSSSDEQQVPNDRLQQFNELRAQTDEDYAQHGEGADVEPMAQAAAQMPMAGVPQQQPPLDARLEFAESIGQADLVQGPVATLPRSSPSPSSGQKAEVLSLTQQVQKAASEKQPPNFAPLADSGSTQTDNTGLPQPFPPPPLPPPQSLSPLPAPAAQRNRYQLPDALAIAEESRARSQTSSVETPGAVTSLAPWARDVSEGPKGPSLKEIQEAEARKAAEVEEAAAAARRSLLEQELQRLSQQAGPSSASPQGLPSTSTWGSGTSPATPTAPGASAWTKPLAGKLSAGVGEASSKKTLSQIQHEEETRKQKAAAAALAAAATQNANASANAPPAAGTSSGKRYADLAGKAVPSQAAAGNSGGAWTTVGATGKAKLPPPASGPAGNNASWTSVRGTGPTGTAGTGVVATGKGKSASSATAVRKGPAASGPASEPPNATEEFTKWAKSTLSKGLNSNINGE
jgi:PERQ amino acid-rich with GYF domain-containing protein